MPMIPENALMIKNALAIASKIGAEALLLHIDPLDDLEYLDRIPRKLKIILISRRKKLDVADKNSPSLLKRAHAHVIIPRTTLTRISLIKIAAMLCMAQELFTQNSKIVFLTGHAESGILDLIHHVDTSKESEVITGKGLTKIASIVRPEVFQSVLNIATELSDKGREGKPIGTIFVIGDHERTLQISRQMIMNPFQGYDEDERNIMSAAIKDTVREFSSLDGAFIISDEGTIITAGRYLGAAAEDTSVPRGLGSRHLAAAGITALTKSMAFVISESSGDIRIFKDGKIIMHLEKASAKR